jgi:predicted Zn-dependent protease
MSGRVTLAAGLAALALAGCAATTPRLALPLAAPNVAPAERLSRAVDLLNRGQAAQARAELKALLAVRPDDSRAARLMREIDEDPQLLLGSRSYPYTVRPGETMSVLAERFLGDSLMFYALGRYNHIAAPADLTAGRVLLIPGAPRKVAVAPTSPAVSPQSQPQPQAQAIKPPAARDHGLARMLRASALECMNRGQINRAVGLLRHAALVDPADPLVARDLARAVRIQAAVHAR